MAAKTENNVRMLLYARSENLGKTGTEADLIFLNYVNTEVIFKELIAL